MTRPPLRTCTLGAEFSLQACIVDVRPADDLSHSLLTSAVASLGAATASDFEGTSPPLADYVRVRPAVLLRSTACRVPRLRAC